MISLLATFKLQRELLKLVHHDQATAQRLVNGAKLMNPRKSHKWVLEKAIYDLKRDRRC